MINVRSRRSCQGGDVLTCGVTFPLRHNGLMLDPEMVMRGREASGISMISVGVASDQ